MTRIGIAALAAVCLASGTSRADDLTHGDELFQRGLALRATDPVAACKLFEEAHALNPHATGILLNAALCDEKAGRIASAAEKFDEAAKRAREQNLSCNDCAKPELESAEAYRDKLLPDLPHVRIVLTEPLPDLRIVVDGKVVPTKIATYDLRVDPGARTIEVSAPGRVTYRTTPTIKVRERRDIVIPALARSVVRSSKKAIGKIALIGGGATVAASVLVGYYASRKYDEPFDLGLCDRATLDCNDRGDGKIKTARTIGNVGTAVGIVGLVAIGVGGYLYLTAPRAREQDGDGAEPSRKRKQRRTRPEDDLLIVPQVGLDLTGVVAVGRF
ncbi:MAG: hypothetical protein KIT31_02385 [Deltaproteobacteria bacterium]|nr:hypothetical protein [Deltaproteobacteria bacterium]